MKKNLKNLELSIPSIDILESRKIVGGYSVNDTIDDDWWQGSAGARDDPYELPEVIVTPDERPDSGMDPNETYENQEYEADQGRNEGYDGRDEGRDDGNYNVNAAIQHLRDNALARSQGSCARYVRQALEAGGLNTTGRPDAAGDYDTFLPTIGFQAVDVNNYVPQAGDIVVHEAREGREWGHIAMYDGQNWISDFIQRDMFGGSAYRENPDYTIWRR